jgi:hypothetical protein
MGEGPQDQPAADPRPRAPRPRPAAGGRRRPAASGAARGRASASRATNGGAATGRAGVSRAAEGRAGVSRAAEGRAGAGRAATGRAAAGRRRSVAGDASKATAGRRPLARAAAVEAADEAPAPATARPSRPPSRPRPAAPGPSGPSRTTVVTVLSVLTVVVISLVLYAFILRPSEGGSGQPSAAAPTTTVDPDAPGTTLPDSQFATFTSERQGFSIRYPREWQALVEDDGGLLLDAGGGDFVSARLVQRTEVPTTVDNLPNIKAVTDGIVGSNRTAVILKQQAIMVDGMPGYYYLYTFTDEETGGQGAHAHYFLFRGRNMYTMVFQALPSEGFPRLSRVFDQIATSLRTQPDTGPAPSTDAPPAPPAG